MGKDITKFLSTMAKGHDYFLKAKSIYAPLDKVAKAEGAEQIVVARSSEGGFVNRVFGTSTVNLVLHASVPVTVVP